MMTEQRVDFRPWGQCDDASLLRFYQRALTQMKAVQSLMGRVEQEVRRRAEERGGTGILDETFECRLVSATSYDKSRFTPLKELLPDRELGKCYTPAHDDVITVPERWDAGQVKAACRRAGGAALACFESAIIPGPSRLIFRYHAGREPSSEM